MFTTNKIYQAGIMAIPLKKDESFLGSLQPNYLIIDGQSGWFPKTPFINPTSKEVELKTCVLLQIRFVIRGLWEDGVLKETIVPDRGGSEKLPIELLGLIANYSTLIAQETLVNAVFSLFTFDNGHDLNGYVPFLDVPIATNILNEIELEEKIQILLQTSFAYKEEVVEYIAVNNLNITFEELVERYYFSRLPTKPA
jgi:hypothetical protein